LRSRPRVLPGSPTRVRFESAWTGLAYPSSKAAVSMLTIQYARAFPELRVNVVDPGYTATDLNGHRGTQTVEQGAAPIVAAAMTGPGGPTATFTAPSPVIAAAARSAWKRGPWRRLPRRVRSTPARASGRAGRSATTARAGAAPS
jgi:NAD(P)-dependent dehydrogenase (short-subunit alcohol dehydrogenase family)